MPQRASNAKRERQYEHVKEGYEERGTPEGEAEEIAARTLNKERATRSGLARERPRPRAPRLFATSPLAGRSKRNKKALERELSGKG